LAEPTRRKVTGPPCAAARRSDPAGVVHVHDFTAARTVLRSRQTVQAGFGVDAVSANSMLRNPPIVYLDGDAHRRQQRWTARLHRQRHCPRWTLDAIGRADPRRPDRLRRRRVLS
jgi:hypothetical protein